MTSYHTPYSYRIHCTLLLCRFPCVWSGTSMVILNEFLIGIVQYSIHYTANMYYTIRNILSVLYVYSCILYLDPPYDSVRYVRSASNSSSAASTTSAADASGIDRVIKVVCVLIHILTYICQYFLYLYVSYVYIYIYDVLYSWRAKGKN